MGKKKAVFDPEERSAFLKKFTHTHQEKKKIKKKNQERLLKAMKGQKVKSVGTEEKPKEVKKPEEERTEKEELVDDRTGEVVEVSTTMEANRP